MKANQASLGLKSIIEDVWLNNQIKVALTTTGYSFDQDTHDSYNDVTNEITDANYTAGGFTLSGKTVTYDPATNKIACYGADITFPGVLPFGKIVVYDATSTSKRLLAVNDCEGTVTTDKITWPATGMLGYNVA